MPSRRVRRFASISALSACTLGLAVGASGCVNPRSEAATAQALNDAATEIDGLKADIAQVQTAVDSLRDVVAHQDTVITRLAALNNVPR